MKARIDIDIEELLAGIPLFADLGPDSRGEISRECKIRELGKGAVIFREGDRPIAMYYLLQGQIKRSVCSQDGDEKVLDVYCPRQYFGEVELFSDRLYLSRAETTADSRVLQIGHRALAERVSNGSEIASRMLRSVANRLYALERDIVARRFQSTADRVLDYLCELASDDPSGETATLHLGISKQVLASHLDMTPETLSRTLRRLIDDEVVEVRGRLVQLNLRAVAERSAARSAFVAAPQPTPTHDARHGRIGRAP